MSDGIYSALSGAVAQDRALEVAANNAANINTTGYKGDLVVFREVLNRTKEGPSPDVMRYVVGNETRTVMTSGVLRETGNPLDLALQGEGFFTLKTPGGIRYTTAGSFTTDRKGIVSTKNGYEVLASGGGPLIVPADTKEISVSPDGTLSADQETIGQLRITRFRDRTLLRKEGASMFVAPSAAAPMSDGESTVVQGYLEGSNVHAVGSVTDMIKVSRYFDAFQRIINTFKQLDQRTARELGRRF